MSRNKDEMQDVTLLGQKNVKYDYAYSPDVLETFENKHPDNDYWVKFNCPEFTSLCPITGQPDFATIYISYVPNIKMVESKSLKLFLGAVRNHGTFAETIVNQIRDLHEEQKIGYRRLARMFNLSRGAVQKICNYSRRSQTPSGWRRIK